ncbi:hypothetical protein PISMIDRAFT_682852, partial [Pisolithus microcarpus 441]
MHQPNIHHGSGRIHPHRQTCNRSWTTSVGRCGRSIHHTTPVDGTPSPLYSLLCTLSSH